MKRNYLLLAGGATILVGAFVVYQYKIPAQKIYNTQEVAQIINDTYTDVSGFNIAQVERQFIEDQGGNPTYGEITTESVAQLLNDLHLTVKDLFFDLGSGVGKVCVQVALTTPARAIGVELSQTRAQGAQRIKEELLKHNILTDANKLKFIEQNILNTDLSKATAIFMCSTCFSDSLMEALANKMATECKNGLRVITLKDLPVHPQFNLVKTYELPMTWSQGSPVYLYELIKN
jgi:precorrin-6B methylase 2